MEAAIQSVALSKKSASRNELFNESYKLWSSVKLHAKRAKTAQRRKITLRNYCNNVFTSVLKLDFSVFGFWAVISWWVLKPK